MVPPGAKKLPPAGIESKGRTAGSAGWSAWIPPFLVGAVGAMTAELTAGLLVYSTQGFLRSLSVVLATEMLGLGLGLWSSRSLDPGELGAARRRWLTLVAALAVGAGFAAAWGVERGFSASGASQMLGLALLGGFPLFATGSVLGAVAAVGPDRSVGAPSSLGAAAGVLGSGLLGVPSFEPTSFFLLGVVGVSVAALLHGRLVDRVLVAGLLEEDGAGAEGPVLRVEDRIRGDRSARLWSVDGRPAAGMDAGRRPLLPWERAAEDILTGESDGRGRILLVGSIGGGLEDALLRESGSAGFVLVEPWGRAAALRRRLRPRGSGEEGSDVLEGLPATGGAVGVEHGFDGVVVYLRLLPGGGPFPGAGLELLAAAARSRNEEGVLVLGGAPLGEDGTDFVAWVAKRPWSPGRLILLRPRRPGAAGPFLHEGEGWGGGLLLGTSARAGDPWNPDEMDAVFELPGATDGAARPPERGGPP